jgi:putative tricarboxylic transport membrane protein
VQHTRQQPSARWSRRVVLGTAIACGLVAAAAPALAEIRSLEIIAPAGPGGGYDQLARAAQEVLEKHGLASGVQVTNIPGAGGTIGLAQFVTKSSRSPSRWSPGSAWWAPSTSTSRR